MSNESTEKLENTHEAVKMLDRPARDGIRGGPHNDTQDKQHRLIKSLLWLIRLVIDVFFLRKVR